MAPKLILGKYELLRELGSGGSATVYLAQDTVILRNVAIKCMALGGEPYKPPTPIARSAQRAGQRAPQFADDSQVFVLPWEDQDEAYARFARTNPTKVQNCDFSFDPSGETQALGLDEMFAANPIQGAGQRQGMNDRLQGRLDTSEVSGLGEARTIAKLIDENIVTLYDFGVEDNTAYLVMEYVEGVTLTKFLAHFDDQLTLDTIAAIFDSVAHALEIAHAKGVLHLDIKPDNIMINRQGQVKVTDFGLASIMDLRGFGHAGGGTIGYMPPEQMHQQDLDERCDEWAFASILYQMLVGKNPFMIPAHSVLTLEDLDRAEAAICESELVLPSELWDELDEEADNVLFRALDPDREDRYRGIAQFADEMAPFLGDPDAGYEDLRGLMNSDDFVFGAANFSADYARGGAGLGAGGALAGGALVGGLAGAGLAGAADAAARGEREEKSRRRGLFSRRRSKRGEDDGGEIDDAHERRSEAAAQRRAEREERRRAKQAAQYDDWYAKELSAAQQKEAARHPVRHMRAETGFALVGRLFSAVGCAFMACVALVNFPSIASLANPLLWPLLACFAAAGLLFPSIASAAAFVLLGVALCMNNSAVLGVFLIVSSAGWWLSCARFGKARSNAALAYPVAGAFGFAQLAPLLSGFCLRLMDALVTTLFGIIVALTLAGFGSGDLLSWDILSYFRIHTSSVQISVLSMLLLPQTWCIILSWLVTAVVLALGCVPRLRILAGLAGVVGTVVLVVGLGVAQWFVSGQTDMFPPIDTLIPTLISGVVIIAAGFTAVPGRSR